MKKKTLEDEQAWIFLCLGGTRTAGEEKEKEKDLTRRHMARHLRG